MTRLFTPLFPARHGHRPADDARRRRSSSAPHRALETPEKRAPHDTPQNTR
ncbi:hypothetical protein GCM10027174_21130 [Salinifilum aidingensis]